VPVPSTTRRRAATVGRPTTAEVDILAATQRLLDRGATFTELGVQQICTEAGVARSTFYSHFRDKVELVVRMGTELLSSAFDQVSAWTPADGLSGLVAVFREVMTTYRRHGVISRAITEVASYDATVREFSAGQLRRFTTRTLAALVAEQEAGHTPPTVDAALATRLIVVGGEAALADQVATGDPATDEAFAEELAATWWYGVYRRPTGKPDM